MSAKGIKDLNISKVLEGIIGVNIHDLGFGTDFLAIMQNLKEQIKRIDKLIILKHFPHQKGLTTEWGKVTE